MKCDKAEANLVAYIDGELPSRALPEFERHIKGCPVCRQSLEELRELIECRIPREVPAPSRDLLPHIERRIAAPAYAQITTLRRLSIAAAAAVALIAAGWLYRVNFLRGPGAEARTVAAALAQVKELTGWESVHAVTAELAISEVEAVDPAQASFIPLPSPGGEPVRDQVRIRPRRIPPKHPQSRELRGHQGRRLRGCRVFGAPRHRKGTLDLQEDRHSRQGELQNGRRRVGEHSGYQLPPTGRPSGSGEIHYRFLGSDR